MHNKEARCAEEGGSSWECRGWGSLSVPQTKKRGKDEKKQGRWVRSAWDGKGKFDLSENLTFS